MLSAVLAVVMLTTLITLAGPWEFIAITRLLDPLVEGGFVQYHDLGPGFIPGLPDVGYYYMSQDPIDWRLVITAAVLMMFYPFFKGIQFHVIARQYGSPNPLAVISAAISMATASIGSCPLGWAGWRAPRFWSEAA